jgi:glycosyltransferase involved in cell wall biosynthesis
MPRLKIAYLTTALTVGGAEWMLCRLLSRVDRDRFDPVVVCLRDRASLAPRIEALGVPVHAIGMEPGVPTSHALLCLCRIIRRVRPGLIHGWMYHGNLAAQVASLLSGRRLPVLWSIHNSVYSLADEKKMTAAVIRLCARLSRLPVRTVFVSETSRAQHLRLGYCKANSCVIPNGYDTSVFAPSAEARLAVRSELGIPRDSFLIGSMARFHPMKDHVTFLRAAALLREEHPEVHIVLAGRGVDCENSSLGRWVKELGLCDSTHLLGERQDVPRLMAALDIVASSSAYGEAFPLAIGEAMACGVPCVVTDVGDSSALVGATGVVVPPRDPAALARAWRHVMGVGAEQRQAWGKAARDRIARHYGLSQITRQYEELYSLEAF